MGGADAACLKCGVLDRITCLKCGVLDRVLHDVLGEREVQLKCSLRLDKVGRGCAQFRARSTARDELCH